MRMPLFGELPTKRSPPAAAILIWNLPPEVRLPAADKKKETGRPRPGLCCSNGSCYIASLRNRFKKPFYQRGCAHARTRATPDRCTLPRVTPRPHTRKRSCQIQSLLGGNCTCETVCGPYGPREIVSGGGAVGGPNPQQDDT